MWILYFADIAEKINFVAFVLFILSLVMTIIFVIGHLSAGGLDAGDRRKIARATKLFTTVTIVLGLILIGIPSKTTLLKMAEESTVQCVKPVAGGDKSEQ